MRKGLGAARASADAKIAEAIIHEPQGDWVPLKQAPFFCASGGRICSVKTWPDAFYDDLRKMTSQIHTELRDPELVGLPAPEWSVLSDKSRPSVWVTAMDISTDITPGSVFVSPDYRTKGPFGWLVGGLSDAILKDPEWDEIPPQQRVAARWHRRLLETFFRNLHGNLADAVRSGAAHLMARKNSVLAPFERVTWDQWHFFRLDDDHNPRSKIWYDPRNPDWELAWRGPCSATGPAGERLYGLHIAPGVVKNDDGLTAEEKCQQWLRGMLRDHPERPPRPLEGLAKEAVSLFGGLSKRGFLRCYSYAQKETGNRNWSRPGAPPKSPQKSLRKK